MAAGIAWDTVPIILRSGIFFLEGTPPQKKNRLIAGYSDMRTEIAGSLGHPSL